MDDGGVREPPFDHLKKPGCEQCWLDDDISYAWVRSIIPSEIKPFPRGRRRTK
jgi:hypothetical protein